MLPVSAWPPGPPGASLSPFGRPRTVDVGRHPRGFVIPKGAWVVQTGGNRVVMFQPREDPWNGVNRTPGTELLPAAIMPPPHPPAKCPPPPGCKPQPRRWQKHDVVLEEWRAWQRQVGRTPPPIRPTPGRRPPNWFGWKYVCAPSVTLVQPGSGGLVVADGQNVVIAGGGCATITQAYSV